MPSLSSIGNEFWLRLASFAFQSYLEVGIGVCILKEQPAVKAINAPLRYLPYDPDNSGFEMFPAETLKLLDEYDPLREVVLAVVDKGDEALVLKLSAQKLGAKPIDAYRAWLKANSQGVFIPGELVGMKTPVPDIQAGQYIFLRRTGAMMELCRAGIDPETDEICRTGEIVRCHADFEICFEGVGDVIVGTRA